MHFLRDCSRELFVVRNPMCDAVVDSIYITHACVAILQFASFSLSLFQSCGGLRLSSDEVAGGVVHQG